MLFASCSNDETVEVAKNQNGIQFKSFVNNSTRATDLTTANLTDFQVWGIMKKDNQIGKPFVGTQVNKAGGAWSYGTPVYWEKGYQYSFVAVAPAGAFEMETAPADYQDYGKVKFNNGRGDTDLLWATNNKGLVTWDGDVCPAAVDLTFNHMLSRVRFQFENGMLDGSKLTVTNVKINDAYTSGTATLAEQLANLSWAPGQATGALEFGNAAAMEQNVKEATAHKYMIPAIKTYNLTFTVKREHHGVTDTYNHNVNLQELTFEPGKSYQLTAKFTAENINPDEELCPITFTATVNSWAEFGNTNFNLKSATNN